VLPFKAKVYRRNGTTRKKTKTTAEPLSSLSSAQVGPLGGLKTPAAWTANTSGLMPDYSPRARVFKE